MATSIPMIPSLSDLGWVSDGSVMLSKIMSYYILTDHGQSLAFQNELISLPETYSKHIHDPDKLKDEIESELNTLLSRYFVTSEVETETNKITESHYKITIYAAAIDHSGVKHSMGKVIDLDIDNINRILDIGNTGKSDRIMRG